MKRFQFMTGLKVITPVILICLLVGCTKFFPWKDGDHPADGFDLNVSLFGEGKSQGFVKFRQDADTARIVNLDTWLTNLKPNTSYLLQRAVDQVIDGNCTGTAWLTLGKGTVAQSITTDSKGNGHEELFRNLSAFERGTKFDIHFQIIEEQTSAVVLTSGCHQFAVR